MRIDGCCRALLALLLLIVGCDDPQAASGRSDVQARPAADVSILFIGNSHTSFHGLPDLVRDMIRFRHPEKKVESQVVGVAFLEDSARDPRCRRAIESRRWDYVVLQAQKISMSGRFEYSREEGIALAKLAKSRGAGVFFFAEWGLKGVAGDGARQEKVYREMARAAGVKVAPVARAWDLALSRRPDLPLHAPDGNHQSPLGAFLTACVLFGHLTGESSAPLATFPYEHASKPDRAFLAKSAAESAAGEVAEMVTRPTD